MSTPGCIALILSTALASVCTRAEAAEGTDQGRAEMTAQMLLMALPQCLNVDGQHAKRAQTGWQRWWTARADVLSDRYKRPLVKPPRLDSGPFAMSRDDVRQVCEEMLAVVENDPVVAAPADTPPPESQTEPQPQPPTPPTTPSH